jgi:hypothetical protein
LIEFSQKFARRLLLGNKKAPSVAILGALFIGELVRFFLQENRHSSVKVCEFFTTSARLVWFVGDKNSAWPAAAPQHQQEAGSRGQSRGCRPV